MGGTGGGARGGGGGKATPGGGGKGAGGELESLSKQELYERAKELDVAGRSSMTKEELARAIELAA